MSKPKIVVVKLKQLLLTAALVLLGIILILLGIAWASTKKEASSTKGTPSNTPHETTTKLYNPGVYTSSISIGDTLVHLELVCDDTHINSIRLVNLDEHHGKLRNGL